MSTQYIANINVLVHDYDDAIDFYTEKLGFHLLDNIDIGQSKRWVRVSPKPTNNTTSQCAIVLSKANDEQKQLVGNQAGRGVLLFLQTDDFWADYHRMKANGVTFDEQPRDEPYATVVVFRDLYGNGWDLIQPKG